MEIKDEMKFDELKSALDELAQNIINKYKQIYARIDAKKNVSRDYRYAIEYLPSCIMLRCAYLKSLDNYELQQMDFIDRRFNVLDKIYQNLDELLRHLELRSLDNAWENIKKNIYK